jgi:tetratricopeptide (TPR) repeat protein
MLGVLLAEGKPAEAEKVLQRLAPTLLVDDRERETRRLAMAFARSGNFAHAEELTAADSSIAGLDLRGRLRLFAGDLVQATALLKAAGPYDDEREHAVQRVTLLVMIQSAGTDSLRDLGAALLSLERGDSAAAMRRLADLSPRLAPAGAAEAHFLVGQLALAARDTIVALRFLRLADDTLVPGVAPAARMLVARIIAGSGRAEEARALLERLIVDYPESAVVPEARRFRDALRGAIPGGGR